MILTSMCTSSKYNFFIKFKVCINLTRFDLNGRALGFWSLTQNCMETIFGNSPQRTAGLDH